MDEVAEHLVSQPELVRSKILYVQPCYGSTGDLKPWPGHPADPQFNLTSKSEEFLQYIREVNTRLCAEYLDTGIIPLYNGVWDEIDEVCPRHWKKRGKVAHGYQMNGEQNDEAINMPILREWVDDDFPMRARGELSQKPTEEGWWQEGLVSNFMVHYAWMLHYGMDFSEQNHPYINSEALWPAHRFFNRHIHDKHVELAAGGFCYLRQQLDSADKVLWPEEEFGKAKVSNKERMVAIAEWNAEQGAKQGDPENGVGTQSHNRGARALNDVGWEVHAGNYEANLYQVEPDETSLGLWRVGDIKHELYGRFARAFHGESSWNEMYFRLNTSLWGNLPLQSPRLLTLSIAYWDEGVGTWSVSYDGIDGPDTGSCSFHCFEVTKTDTGRWKEATWELTDGWFEGRGPRQADIWLTNTDMEDDTFGLIEIFDPDVVYTLPTPIDNLFQLHSTYVDSHHPDQTFNGTGVMFIRQQKRIAFFRFPSWEPSCVVESVYLRLWQAGQGDPEKELAVQRVEEEWELDTLTWNSKPALGQILLTFQLESGDQYTQLDVTQVLGGDPTALENFAIAEITDLEATKLDNEVYREPRLVTYCQSG